MTSIIDELAQKRDDLLASLDDTANRISALPLDAPDEERGVLDDIFKRDNEAVKRLTADIRRREEVQRQRSEVKPQDADGDTDKPAARAKGSSNEPLTYRQGGSFQFFRDLHQANKGDAEAQQRLQRHAAEMRVELRDISSTATAGGEFIPPLYLQNQWIELLRAGRPTADAVQSFPLPANTMSINLPRLATGAATAIQASENAARAGDRPDDVQRHRERPHDRRPGRHVPPAVRVLAARDGRGAVP
jgi:HK97 family phage major capsid protein